MKYKCKKCHETFEVIEQCPNNCPHCDCLKFSQEIINSFVCGDCGELTLLPNYCACCNGKKIGAETITVTSCNFVVARNE